MDIKKVIGFNVRAFRELRGFSQAQLGKKAGLHGVYIGYIERGERNISVDNLSKIAKALHIPVSTIVTEGVDQWLK